MKMVEVLESRSAAYPLVTIVSQQGVSEHPVALRESLARKVTVKQVTNLADAHARVLEAARQGAAVAFIRNTVASAQDSYDFLRVAFAGEVDLFHARFAMGDRLSIEERVVR